MHDFLTPLMDTPLINSSCSWFNSSYLAEFAGTMFLLIFGNGVCANASLMKTKGNKGGFFMVVTGWAIGVALVVFMFMRASGAHFNPAITVTFALAGNFPWSDVAPYLIAQLTGAFIGAVFVYLVYFKHFQATEDGDDKLGLFCTMPAIRSPLCNCLTEILATATLLFVVTGLGYAAKGADGAELFDPGFSALCVGMLILAIGLALGGPTGFAINPARDLGPRLAHFILPMKNKRDSDWGYAPVPILGPMIGGVLGYLMWYAIFGAQTLPEMMK